MNKSELSLVSSDVIRGQFAAAMSAMYQQEVPAYGTLLDIVATINAEVLASAEHAENTAMINAAFMPVNMQAGTDAAIDNPQRLAVERHGAIRLGTAAELAMMRRVFAVIGMFPVGYYDLAPAGIPVHSTAFRPVSHTALSSNPFRVFTSLLRPELIADEALREQTSRILQERQIFTETALKLVEVAEMQGGLTTPQTEEFVAEILQTFRWHAQARVSSETYQHLHHAHPLIADIVAFRGPHINHLTPRVLDIDRVQDSMPEHGIAPKAVIEGPPPRNCPVLLRQTSFKALSEAVTFPAADGTVQQGKHTARFGEVEQRGVALTPKGRALYDRLLAEVRATITPAADGSNSAEYLAALQAGFVALPDDWRALLDQQLAYFTFHLTDSGKAVDTAKLTDFSVAGLLDQGLICFAPIIYEDFLPVSAAGIFQSNLGDNAVLEIANLSSQQQFEAALGAAVSDEFSWYEKIQTDSLQACLAALQPEQRE